MTATATASLNGKTDLPRHVEPSPADLVAQARAAADHDRARQKERRDGWLAAQHQIATVLAGATADCLAMERESIAAMQACEQLLCAYAPDLAAAVAAVRPAPTLHSLPPRGGVPGWSRYEQIATARDVRPIYAVPMDPPAAPPSEPPLEPDPQPEPEGDPGPAQVPPDAENVRAARLAGYEGEPCPACGELKLVRSGGRSACDACGARDDGVTRPAYCPACLTLDDLPAAVKHEICGACALEGRTVPLLDGPPPAAPDTTTGTKAAPVKRPPATKPKPGKPKGK